MKKIQKFSHAEIESTFQESLNVNVASLCGKVNEIIDVVNDLQKEKPQKEDLRFLDSNNKPIDFHSLWVDKLCRFWDDTKEDCVYGKLDKVRDDTEYKYVCAFDNGGFDGFKNCEYVSPLECFTNAMADPSLYRINKENEDLKILLSALQEIENVVNSLKVQSISEEMVAKICKRTFHKLWKE